MAGLVGMLHEHIPALRLVTISQRSLRRSFAGFRLPFGRRVFVDTESEIARRSQIVRAALEVRAEALKPPVFPPNANSFELSRKRWLSDTKHPFVADLTPAMEEADLVLHNAELLNYSANPVSLRGMFLIWFAKKQLGKLAGLINQTTPSSTEDPVMSGILDLVCPDLDVVTVREPLSQKAMQARNIPCAMVPDPAFRLGEDSYDVEGFEAWRQKAGLGSEPYFCLSLSSGLPLMGSEPVVTRLVQSLQGIVPNAVVMAHGGGVWVLKTTASKLDDCFVFEGTYRQVWPLLKSASFLVSGHYHNLIMAAMVGCPFVPLTGISHKIEGLLELLGWPSPRTYNPTALAGDVLAIIQDCRRVLGEHTTLSRHLLERSAEMHDLSEKNAILIRDLIA